jgi:hypothetical protein
MSRYSISAMFFGNALTMARVPRRAYAQTRSLVRHADHEDAYHRAEPEQRRQSGHDGSPDSRASAAP